MMLEILGDNWQAYLWRDGLHLSGLAMTLWLLLLSVGIGFLLALPLACARASERLALRAPVWCFTYLLRGTPLYVQLLLCYSGLYALNIVREQPLLERFFRDGLNCTVLAFSLNTCAYLTEVLAGAIRTTPAGELEAARAFGMGRWSLYRRVLLPSALRRALPALSNEVILVLHSTSVAFTATVPELLKVARDISSATFSPFAAFGIAGLLYACTAFCLVGLFRRGEQRWLAPLQPQSH